MSLTQAPLVMRLETTDLREHEKNIAKRFQVAGVGCASSDRAPPLLRMIGEAGAYLSIQRDEFVR